VTPECRERLGALQAELVRALTGRAEAPEGFDPARVEATAEALRAKRARSVVRAWPALARSLGDDFGPSFWAYAAGSPLPLRGGPLADGRGFARALARVGRLTDPRRLEALAVDLRFASRPVGLVRRRGPALAATVLSHPGRLILAARCPGLGARTLIIPLGPFGRLHRVMLKGQDDPH
jgi:hypothetical protein